MAATTTVEGTTKIDLAIHETETSGVRPPFQAWLGHDTGARRQSDLSVFRTVGIKRLATWSARFDMIGGEALKKNNVA